MAAELVGPPGAPVPTRHVLDVDDLGTDGLDAVLALAGWRPGRASAVSWPARAWPWCSRSRPTAPGTARRWPSVALGGHPVYIQGHEVGLDVRESAADVARTLACYHSVLCARVIDHTSLVRMAAALDDAGRRRAGGQPALRPGPSRARPLADLLTLRQMCSGRTRSPTGPWPTSATPTTCGGRWPSPRRWPGIATRVASPDGYGPSAGRRRAGQVLRRGRWW